MKAIEKKLLEYFNPSECIISEEKSLDNVKNLLNSKTSPCWNQGKIGNTGYYLLAQASRQRKEDRRATIVCKNELVEMARIK